MRPAVCLTELSGGAAWLLPRIVGLSNATELLMTGDFISAQRAYEIGLYNKVVPEAELATRTADYARRLASVRLSGHCQKW